MSKINHIDLTKVPAGDVVNEIIDHVNNSNETANNSLIVADNAMEKANETKDTVISSLNMLEGKLEKLKNDVNEFIEHSDSKLNTQFENFRNDFIAIENDFRNLLEEVREFDLVDITERVINVENDLIDLQELKIYEYDLGIITNSDFYNYLHANLTGFDLSKIVMFSIHTRDSITNHIEQSIQAKAIYDEGLNAIRIVNFSYVHFSHASFESIQINRVTFAVYGNFLTGQVNPFLLVGNRISHIITYLTIHSTQKISELELNEIKKNIKNVNPKIIEKFQEEIGVFNNEKNYEK